MCRDDVLTVTNVRESCDLLWTEVYNKKILEDIDKTIVEFEQAHDRLDEDTVITQRDLIGALYAKCLRMLLHDTRLREKTAANRHFLHTVKVAVETYILHGLRKLLPRSVSSQTAIEDAILNKTIKNLHDVQLLDLGVRSDIYDGILRGKLELSRLDGYTTVLGKIGCLKKAVRYISEGVALVSSDDILPVLIFLVIRAGIPNWIAQLAYTKHFRFSVNSPNDADEAGFLITSLEAAVEHVRSGVLTKSMLQETSENLLDVNGRFKDTVTNDNRDEDIGLLNLFAAVRKCDLSEVGRILLQDSDKSPRSLVKLCHPLCSCEACETRLTRASLTRWPTVRSRDDRGMTAIHVASLCGHVGIVDFLLEHDADPDDADADGSTPLHCAASRGHQNTLLLLLHANADPTITDTRGNTPLHLAADHGHDGCVKALLYFTEQIRIAMDKSPANSNGDTPLHYAAKWGYGNIVEILMEHGANPRATNRRCQTPLVVSHSSQISQLLEGISKTEVAIINCKTSLSSANARSTSSMTNPEKKSRRWSHSSSITRKVDRLLDAITEGDLRLACYYLGLEGPQRTPVDQVSSLCHPLCNCEKCATSNEESTEEQERTPSLGMNVANEKGETALHVACATGRTQLVQILLDAGASVNVTTTDGRTPLHLATSNGWVKIVKLLLNCGNCDINAKDSIGDTPLHLVARIGNTRIVQLLVKYGVNTEIRNSRGSSALEDVETVASDDIFLAQSFSSILKILKSNGANDGSHHEIA